MIQSTYLFTLSKNIPIYLLGLTVFEWILLDYFKLPQYKKYSISSSIILFLIFIWFFRIEDDTINEDYNTFISPANGTILNISRENGFIDISIFLSLLNKHYQVAPVNGIINDIQYTKGTFNVAFDLKKSDSNEHMHYYIYNEMYGNIIISQIAGTIARQIVPFKKGGDNIKKGEHIGFIKFGSQVNIKLRDDKNYIITKKIGDIVDIGEVLIRY
jgi:phosphatidylserine decarboxylase